MYLRTVLRSRPLWRAMTETDMPCRCHSRIMTTSLSWITACPPDHQEQHRRREPAGLPGGGQKHQQPRSPGDNSIGRSRGLDCGLNRAYPAYIDGGTFERNQEQMAANRNRYPGIPRGGGALLGGLVACGVCGRRMFTGYNDDGHEARYVCNQMAATFGAPRCQSISARPVDEHVSALMLSALAPSAIEVSLQVAEDLELERQQLHEQWKQ